MEERSPLHSLQEEVETIHTSALAEDRETNDTLYVQFTSQTQLCASTCVSEANSNNTNRTVGDRTNKVCL